MHFCLNNFVTVKNILHPPRCRHVVGEGRGVITFTVLQKTFLKPHYNMQMAVQKCTTLHDYISTNNLFLLKHSDYGTFSFSNNRDKNLLSQTYSQQFIMPMPLFHSNIYRSFCKVILTKLDYLPHVSATKNTPHMHQQTKERKAHRFLHKDDM